MRSAFFHVFKLYAESSGGQYVAVKHIGFPGVSSQAYGARLSPLTLPSLDAFAVIPTGTSGLQIYVVNRDLVNDVFTCLAFDGVSLEKFSTLKTEIVGGATL